MEKSSRNTQIKTMDNKIKTVVLTEEDKAVIRETIIEQVLHGNRPDEVNIEGITLVFDGTPDTSFETCYTGIEMLGDKESFLKSTTTVSNTRLVGAYDIDDEPVKVNIRAEDLLVDYDSDDVVIHWQFDQKDNIRALNRCFPIGKILPKEQSIKKSRKKLLPYVRPSVHLSA